MPLIKLLIYTNKSIRCVVERNQYVFNVDIRLTKQEMKKFFQETFETEVISVNSYILPPKKRKPKYKRVFVKFDPDENPYANLLKKEEREKKEKKEKKE